MSRRVLGFGARLSKLRAMSAAEIARRVQYKALLARERKSHERGTLAPPGRLRASVGRATAGGAWPAALLAARADSRRRFFPSVREQAAMRALFASAYSRELADTATQAAHARGHRFSFFGREFTYGDRIPWQDDPVTGRAWPSVFHADVPVHGGDVGFGDVKHVWELNRHQFLIDLAKSWFLTGNTEDVRALRALVRDWIATNPYGTGVNWSCALEPAFRTFSWLWAYYLTLDALDDEFHVEWLQSFLDHGRFLERHLEHYSSPYNHLMGEAAALCMLAESFPEFDEADRWRRTATAVLTNRLGEQFYKDGGSVEQSTFYHHATVGFLMLAVLSARAAGREMPASLWGAIERGLEFSLALMQPDGSTPAIGGADDGKPIRMEHLRFWDFRPYFAIGAVLFGRGDFKFAAGRFFEDALWLLGPEGLRAFDALEAQAPRQTSEARPDSGYYVLRSGWASDSDYVCFDCGEQAAGMRPDGVPNSMHGHADCLSAIVWLGGRPVLVDSGLFSYNAGGAWEAHFRETAAHSTAKIDGRDQALHIGKMAWSNSYRASCEGWQADGSEAWASGSHDGYDRGPEGVRHRRTVWLRYGAFVAILDEFDGTGTHAIDVNWQFAPGALQVSAEGAVFDETAEIAWASTVPWTATTACGGDGPEGGWIAPSLGIKVPAPRLSLSCTMAQPHLRLLTVIAPPSRGRSARSIAAGFDLAGPRRLPA